jgi:L-ascorbate metabolism protein UlaG (beta-lactamase superfamily)
MKIKFYAHASFRLEGREATIVTDPYEPALSQFDPIDEPADLVLMSSATDRFHCDPSHVLGHPQVLNALDVPPGGTVAKGIAVRAYPGRERYQALMLLAGIFLPRRNALYSFALDGIRVLHTGDIGRPLKPAYADELRGQVDVMFALSGGVHNIELDDLQALIADLRPKIVIPMHYFNPKGRLKILPVTALTDRYPADRVVRAGKPDIDVDRATLPAATTIYVLEPSR